MKLKFKKQKIASLSLISALKGGNIEGESVAFTELPGTGATNLQVCNVSEQVECTASLNPKDCQTNDATIKTWNQQTNTGHQGSQYKYCEKI